MELLSPGVYVIEESSGEKPVQGVGTSTGAFVGLAQKGPLDQAELITSFNQYQETFGGFIADGLLAYAVYQFFSGRRISLLRNSGTGRFACPGAVYLACKRYEWRSYH